jgi:hypothetical protein
VASEGLRAHYRLPDKRNSDNAQEAGSLS